jgi:nitroreductase
MDVEESIHGRRSIRSFRPDPVPPETILGMLETARWSPSWRNTQSWTIWAVSGGALERFKSEFTQKLLSEAPSRPDIEMPGREFPAACLVHAQRLMDVRGACELAAGVDCTPPATSRRVGDLFGAPCMLVLAIDECLPPTYACFDGGIITQSLCLAAYGRGLGTCIMATAVRYPEVLHALLPKSGNKRMLVCIALGYPDTQAAVNTFTRERAELEEILSFVE